MNERLTFGCGAGRPTHVNGAGAASEPPRFQPDSTAAVAVERRERRDWAYIGLLVFTGLLYFRPQDTFRPLALLHLPELAAVFALSAMIMGRMRRGLLFTRFTPELAAVAILGAVILGTAPFSVWMGGAVNTFLDLYAKVVLIFILMVNTLSTPKRIDRLTWLLVLACGYIAGRSVIDYVRGVNLVEYGRVLGSVGGMFKNPNDLALNMVAALPLAVAFVLRSGSALRRLVALGCVVLMLGAIVASHSRSGTVGLAAMVLVMAVQLVRRRPGLVFAGVFVALLAIPLLPEAYLNRMASITDGSRDDTGSRQARSTLLRESWEAFLDDPLTGVGAGQFVNYNPEERIEAWRETHNVILQVAAELGIFGLAAFSYLLVCGARAPARMRKLLRVAARPRDGRRALITHAERTWFETHSMTMLASLAGWFVCALFASVAYHWTLYYLLGLAVAPREVLADRIEEAQPRRRRTALAAVPAGARA
jgi:O-antigen ligase